MLLIVPASTRNAPGLLTGRGWGALAAADSVISSAAHPAWAAHLREAGIEALTVSLPGPDGPTARGDGDESDGGAIEGAIELALAGLDPASTVCWLLDDSPEAVRALMDAAAAGGWDTDLVFASPTAPGSEVVESVRIMHELRSPGGDAWSAQQTHASLARYLLEETYETLEVIEGAEDPVRPGPALVGELGDLLFQIVFHARLGMEEADPYTLDDVARSLNQKMYRRNPHVFTPTGARAGGGTEDIEQIWAQWDAAKRREEPDRRLFDGIPSDLPALQRATKMIARARRAGRLDEFVREAEAAAGSADGAGSPDRLTAADRLASRILAGLLEVQERDEDAESALRTLLTRVTELLGESRPRP